MYGQSRDFNDNLKNILRQLDTMGLTAHNCEIFSRNQTPNSSTLYIFDKEQGKRPGGYDAAIIYWSKVLVPIDELISRLRGKNDLE